MFSQWSVNLIVVSFILILTFNLIVIPNDLHEFLSNYGRAIIYHKLVRKSKTSIKCSFLLDIFTYVTREGSVLVLV